MLAVLATARISSGAYIEIQDEATGLYRHPILDFTGAGVSCTGNAAAGKTTCTIAGGAGGGIATVEDIDSVPTYGSLTKLSFDQADGFTITNPVATEAQIDFTLPADAVTATEIAAGAVGASEAASLDAGDITTGTFADALVSGASETDEVVGTETDEAGCSWEATGSVIECDGSFTTPAANDNDTSPATTAFVQAEIDDGDNLTDNCALEADATPIPDSCVGDGSDDDVPESGDFGALALTGDVTSSGLTTTVADNSVDGTDIALGSDAQGDIMYYDGTNWVRLAKGSAGQVLEINAGATAPEWDTDDGGAATGTITYNVEGFTACCGTTEYMGAGSNNANCNATETNVDITHAGPALTVGNLKCRQKTDATCTVVFTIMKNGGASAASTCTSTNAASCAASTTTDTIANGDTWSIRAVDNASTCTTNCELSCTFTATY